MRSFIAFARIAVLVLASAAITACGSIPSAYGGNGDPAVSPRWAFVAASERIEPVLDELPLYLSAGVVSDNVTDDIAQYGPEVLTILEAYFAGAEACVNIGGQLTSETAVGRICSGDSLGSIYDALDGKMRDWIIRAGVDTKEGQTILAGRLVLNSVVRPTTPGPLVGYRNEPDVPLDDFQALGVRLRAKFVAVIDAAAAHAAKSKPKIS